jgi:RNA polymerase sigma factor for flagellar operon FliA
MPELAMDSLPSSSVAGLDAGDNATRDALLRENLSLVHHVARKLARRLADEADVDELVSAGTLGLMSAAESFDPGRGLAFSTFAVPRIRGAMLDELRRQDHVPRSVRRKTRSMAQARESLMHALGRDPSSHEVADALGVDRATLFRWSADVENAVHLPLDGHSRASRDERLTRAELLGSDDELPDERIAREEEIAGLRDAMLGLDDQERTVLALYYFEELRSREIGELLGVSESRVSQLRARALSRLRGALSPALACA